MPLGGETAASWTVLMCSGSILVSRWKRVGLDYSLARGLIPHDTCRLLSRVAIGHEKQRIGTQVWPGLKFGYYQIKITLLMLIISSTG